MKLLARSPRCGTAHVRRVVALLQHRREHQILRSRRVPARPLSVGPAERDLIAMALNELIDGLPQRPREPAHPMTPRPKAGVDEGN